MSAELDVRLFVGGEWRDGGAGRLAVTDPATGGPAGHVALADQRDVREAVAAAEAAFPAWAALPADERGAVLKRAAALLAERSAEIAAILSREGGKTGPRRAASWAAPPRRWPGTARRPGGSRAA